MFNACICYVELLCNTNWLVCVVFDNKLLIIISWHKFHVFIVKHVYVCVYIYIYIYNTLVWYYSASCLMQALLLQHINVNIVLPRDNCYVSYMLFITHTIHIKSTRQQAISSPTNYLLCFCLNLYKHIVICIIIDNTK